MKPKATSWPVKAATWGGAVEVAREMPDDRPQDPPTVQREARDQVKEPQDQVDAHQPDAGRGQVGDGPVQPPEASEEPGHAETGQRSDDGHAELRARILRLPGDLRHSAEDEQSDALDGDAVAQGDDRVAEFVDQDRSEEEDAGQGTQPPVGGAGQRWVLRWEIPDRQGPGDQSEDQEPTDVQPHRDAQNSAQFDVRFHSYPPFSASATSSSRSGGPMRISSSPGRSRTSPSGLGMVWEPRQTASTLTS
jgi:hypothetical protein